VYGIVCEEEDNCCGIWEECDYDVEVETQCELWIDETSYVWTFENETTWEVLTRTWEYIDNYEFLSSGRWKIHVEVTDNCGNTGSDDVWYEELLVNFEWVVFWWTWPYNYYWDFWDGGTALWQFQDHLFINEWVYEVMLTITDSQGLSWSATVLIKVLEADSCIQDSDSDSVVDCDDACPTIAWDPINDGCPVHETSCDVTCWCEEGYTCSDNDPLTCATWICVPVIETDSSCLYSPSEGNIFWWAVCNTCPCSSYLDFLADVRRCDLVFPAITSPNWGQIFSQWDIWQIY